MNAIEEGNANFDELAKKTESLTKAREGSMKEAAEQHSVLSCDSCEHAEKTNSRDYPVKCMVSKPVPMMVHNYCISWFGYVGCASHSSATPQKMPMRSCFGKFVICPCDDECVVSEYCKDYCEALCEKSKAVKQERERVLDELDRYASGSWFDENPREQRWFREKIASIRQQEGRR